MKDVWMLLCILDFVLLQFGMKPNMHTGIQEQSLSILLV